MSKKKRWKILRMGEIERVLKRKWQRVEIPKDERPEFLKNVPDEIINNIFVSGNTAGIFNQTYGKEQVAGYCVVRDATDHREPQNLNLEHYLIFRDISNDGMLLVAGPVIFEENHHLFELTEDYRNIDVLSYNRAADSPQQ